MPWLCICLRQYPMFKDISAHPNEGFVPVKEGGRGGGLFKIYLENIISLSQLFIVASSFFTTEFLVPLLHFFWYLYLEAFANSYSKGKKSREVPTGCSGKIVFFYISLQPLPRLHRCKRPSKPSMQCKCTVTPIGW